MPFLHLILFLSFPFTHICFVWQANNKRQNQGTRLISSTYKTFLPRLQNPIKTIDDGRLDFSDDHELGYCLLFVASVGLGLLLGANIVSRFNQPKRVIYRKTFKRIQYDAEVIKRFGSPITCYGQESENALVSENIPYKIWSNEDGVEHAEVNFYIRGPHGQGKVLSKMFKGPGDSEMTEWKFQYLIVDIRAPSPAHFILESHVPAYSEA